MNGLEKVISGLACCTQNVRGQNTRPCDGCPYDVDGKAIACNTQLMADALALLKAQEQREPHYTKLEYIVNGMPVAINHPECPRCYDNGLVLWDAEIEKGAAYCKRCGQAVKWE